MTFENSWLAFSELCAPLHRCHRAKYPPAICPTDLQFMRGEVGEVLIQQSDVLSCVPMYNVHNQPVLLAERLVLQEECKVHASVFVLIL